MTTRRDPSSRLITPSLADDATPEAYANAMVKCLGWPPSCSDIGECQRDGICFTSEAAGLRRALGRIEKLRDAEPEGWARDYLSRAIHFLKEKSIHL